MEDDTVVRPRWSARTEWALEETPWARRLAQLRAAGAPLLDLTASNPTQCGFAYDAAGLALLTNPLALRYEPQAKGLRLAREAVSRYYRDHQASVDPEQIFLTTSTSEAYSFLFRLLCDPGDEILIGQPSYPLFDFLARLDDVTLVPYGFFYDHGWHLDREALRRRITPRTRALVVVHPNNPTGHFVRPAERVAMEDLCRERGLALIVDEVFLDYPLGEQEGPESLKSFAVGEHPVPTFVLSGLSKVAALPQMKAAWIACFAEREALDRLEIIADTFLSLSAPVQYALPTWLHDRATVQVQIRQRLQRNMASLDAVLGDQGLVSRLVVEAGWCAVLRIPELQSEEEIVLDLLNDQGVVVHPGGFYGFSGQRWLVISLLTPETEFAEGVKRICSQVLMAVRQFKGQPGSVGEIKGG